MSEHIWQKDFSQRLPDKNQYLWLTKPYILTQALQRVCHELTVEVIEQRFTSSEPDERYALKLDSDEAFIRQVFLLGDAIPLIYGRVMIPWHTYRAYQADFSQLASKPLGETLLYNRANVSRTPFEYAFLVPSHPFLQKIIELRPELEPRRGLWARRSLFHMTEYPLWVTEVFLPTLPPYVE